MDISTLEFISKNLLQEKNMCILFRAEKNNLKKSTWKFDFTGFTKEVLFYSLLILSFHSLLLDVWGHAVA
jgi:hypothetical protein